MGEELHIDATMRKAHPFIAFVCLCCSAPASSAIPQGAAAEELLQKLFPNSSIRAIDTWFGKKATVGVLSPISLRNRHGLISIPNAKLRPVGERYLALAFEILLTDERDVPRLVAAPLAHNPPGALKLLQVVLFDRTTGKAIGKPNGFPLEADGWTCTGDVCSTMNLIGFMDSPPNEAFVVLLYASGIDRRSVIVVAVGADQKPVAAPAVRVGDLGGESGCRIEVSFSSFSMSGDGVYGVRESDCDTSCSDLCARHALPVGKSQTRVQLLRLGAGR